jgi:hypothetical protein
MIIIGGLVKLRTKVILNHKYLLWIGGYLILKKKIVHKARRYGLHYTHEATKERLDPLLSIMKEET